MAYIFPWVKTPVVDGTDDVDAEDHNDPDEQILWLTQFVNNLKEQKILTILPDEPSAAGTIDILTKTAMDTAKTIRASIGASGLLALTATNVAGPGGTGISTLKQTVTVPALAVMGANVTPGAKTVLKVQLYEDSEIVGWADLTVVAP